MAVIVFEKVPTVYHYPPLDKQPDNEATRCGLLAGKRSGESRVVEGNVPTNWEPCDECSERDDRDQRFVGTW